MEKLRERDSAEALAQLTEEQKQQIARVRDASRAKLAELEILHRSAIDHARAKGDVEKIVQLETEYQQDRDRIEREQEDELRAIRERSGS
ncbi:MAG: hypothetical protein JSV80_06090 [Acidobacteriota bacterium]|nr:MAG: hypothetical protein JSV80_06090 [Acidobacteriota bacterium]